MVADPKRKRLRDILAIRNPIILASGPPGRNAKSLIRYGRYAGAVVGKSVTFLPRKGNPPPRIANLGPFGLINWENLPNLGYQRFCEELRIAKEGCDCPVIASLGPSKDIGELEIMASALEGAGADALELDFKWGYDPQTGKTQYESEAGTIGLGSAFIFEIVSALKKRVTIPIVAKLATFVGNLVESAQAAESARADALTAINSVFPAMKISLKRQKPALSSLFGGLSGKSIHPLAVAAVYRLYEAVEIPIMGCGGVTSGEDALEMIMAGAEAVQICTVAMAEGPSAFQGIANELQNLIEEMGLGSVEKCCGLAHGDGS